NVQEAIEHYEHALRVQPDHVKAHDNLGVALAMSRRFDEAVEQYQAALKVKPDDVDAYANMALSYAALKRPQEAIATGEKALALAQSQGHTELAQQIGSWLNSYRAQPGAPTKNLPPPPPPQ